MHVDLEHSDTGMVIACNSICMATACSFLPFQCLPPAAVSITCSTRHPQPNNSPVPQDGRSSCLVPLRRQPTDHPSPSPPLPPSKFLLLFFIHPHPLLSSPSVPTTRRFSFSFPSFTFVYLQARLRSLLAHRLTLPAYNSLSPCICTHSHRPALFSRRSSSYKMRISASLGVLVATGLLGHSASQATDYG